MRKCSDNEIFISQLWDNIFFLRWFWKVITYAAGGRKLSVGNMIYQNGTLKRILIGNEYIENGMYYFYIKDHLENNCIVAEWSGNIIQST